MTTTLTKSILTNPQQFSEFIVRMYQNLYTDNLSVDSQTIFKQIIRSPLCMEVLRTKLIDWYVDTTKGLLHNTSQDMDMTTSALVAAAIESLGYDCVQQSLRTTNTNSMTELRDRPLGSRRKPEMPTRRKIYDQSEVIK